MLEVVVGRGAQQQLPPAEPVQPPSIAACILNSIHVQIVTGLPIDQRIASDLVYPAAIKPFEILYYKAAVIASRATHDAVTEYWEQSSDFAPCLFREACLIELPISKRTHALPSWSTATVMAKCYGLSWNGDRVPLCQVGDQHAIKVIKMIAEYLGNQYLTSASPACRSSMGCGPGFTMING